MYSWSKTEANEFLIVTWVTAPAYIEMSKKTVIIDASSAIILYKAGLHTFLIDNFDIVMPESVYQEITVNPYAGSKEYKCLLDEFKIKVIKISGKRKHPAFANLGLGESDVIELFSQGSAAFILIDDGMAARYCKKAGLPFINSLLVPVVLRCAQIIDEDSCLELMGNIMREGRYSKEVIAYARTCKTENIAFAIP